MPYKRRTRQEKVEAAMEKLNDGITDFFTSEKPEAYKNYLKAMGKLHSYSANNCALILSQYPNATKVAGYVDWQKKFNRHVNRGETGIMVLAPGKGVREVLTDKLDENGNQIIEKRKYTYFFPTYVYDIDQTSGEEFPSPLPRLDFEVKDFDRIMDALRKMAGMPVYIEGMSGTKNGFFSPADNSIHIRAGMPNAQTIKTFIHEMTHSRLHNKVAQAVSKTPRDWMEVEAESTAFIVCDHLGLDTSDYSFGYVSGWSQGKTLADLKTCASNIREAALILIDELDNRLGLISEEEVKQNNDSDRIKEAAQEILDESPFTAQVTGAFIYGERESIYDEKEDIKILLFNETQGYTAFLKVNGNRSEIKETLGSIQMVDAAFFDGYTDIEAAAKRAENICYMLKDKGMDISLSEDIPESIAFDMGYNLTTQDSYTYTELLTRKSIRAVLSIRSEIDEGEIFKLLNDSGLEIDGNKVEINTVMSESLDNWSEHYIERLEKFDQKDTRCPMVTVHATNIDNLMGRQMNIHEAVELFKGLDEDIVKSPTKYAIIKISYIYGGWEYESVQNVDFVKGRQGFLDYLNLPGKTIRHLKIHNELLKMVELAHEFSPGTDYGAIYADTVEKWSDYCRMEINNNSDNPVIPRPPEIDSHYIVMNNDWSMENGG